QAFLPGQRPRRPTRRLQEEMRTTGRDGWHRAPRHFPPSIGAGLRARGIGRIAFPQARARSGWMDTPARTYRAGGSRGIGADPSGLAAPLSRFTPALWTRRDTSNERVDCTTQVRENRSEARWESTLRTEAYTLT